MPGFEGAAGPSIFTVGKTSKSITTKRTAVMVVGGLLAAGGWKATATSHALGLFSAWEVLDPVRPAIFTKIKGDYGGKKYELYYGLGFEEDIAAKHHPATAWFIHRHKTIWGRKSPWSAVQIPSFGFGWGSRQVETGSSSSSSQQNGGPSRQKDTGRPLAGGPTITHPRPPKGGMGGKSARGSKRGKRPRSAQPYCWIHKKRHYCSITTKK